MNINQHNYEEFFLLYVDGELSAAEKQAVEQFVQANPELGVELEMLLQMRLTNDESIVFEGRESLFRNEAAEIGTHNYEEQFLLYVDNELDTVSKEKVETFVLQHPALQESFTLLKQTRLEPETIIFPDKAALYKKEEKERPVFFLRWQRIAAAAAFIGFAVLVWTLLPSNRSVDQIMVKGETKNTNTVQKNNAGVVDASNTSSAIVTKNNAADIAANTAVVNATKQGFEKNSSLVITPAVTDNNERNTNTLLAQSNIETVTGSSKREDIINAVESIDKTQFSQKAPISNAALANADMVKANHAEEPDNTELMAQQTVYKELDTDDEKKSLYVGSLEINKDKLRGFFRKAGSIFRSKSKAEDDKTDNRPASNSRSLK